MKKDASSVAEMSQLSLSAYGGEDGIRVKECHHNLVDGLISAHHYSKKVTQNRWRSFAVFKDGVLLGGMQIGYGIRPEMKQHIIKDATSESVKEFDRMWLSDKLPKNSESRVIGWLLRHLRKEYPELKVLISYADGIRGKIGTIYQATNFHYIGEVKGEFYYIPSEDEWVHPVSMYHRHGTRADGNLKKIYPDIQHIRGTQHRYIYFLDPEWKSHLLVPILEYPKCADSVISTPSDHEGNGGSNPTSAHHVISSPQGRGAGQMNRLGELTKVTEEKGT